MNFCTTPPVMACCRIGFGSRNWNRSIRIKGRSISVSDINRRSVGATTASSMMMMIPTSTSSQEGRRRRKRRGGEKKRDSHYYHWSVQSSSWLQKQQQSQQQSQQQYQFQPLLWRRQHWQQQIDSLAQLTRITRKKMSTSTKSALEDDPKKKKKTIFFQSLGCPRNFVDSEVMLGLAIQQGDMDVTDDAENADVVVVNTCGFLQTARQESKDTIQQLSNYKQQQQQQQQKDQQSPQQQRLVVTGCMVNHYSTKETLLEEFPNVDAVLSSGEVDQIVETLHNLDEHQQHNGNDEEHRSSNNDRKNSKKKTARKLKCEEKKKKQQQQRASQYDDDAMSSTDTDVHTNTQKGRSQRKSFLEQGDTPRFLATPPHYAYLKIAEGCRKRCAFCIIPSLKGKLQSKPINQVVDEFNAILQHGTAHEVILIAQDLGDYGKDFKTTAFLDHGADDGGPNKPMKNKSHLTELLKGLLESMDENQMYNNDDSSPFWLRLLYLYPDEITPDLIDLMQHDKRIARYVDMPIQHINNGMLKRMRRKTTGDDIKSTIGLLRQKLPDISIRTSLMVGFPGETDSHFEELVDFVKTYKLDHVGVFMYENEEGAVSSRMDDQVPSDVKEDRYRRLMEAQWTVVQAKHEQRVQNRERLQVVVEGLAEIEESDTDDEGRDEEENGGFRVVGRHVGQCPDIDGQVILEVDEDDADQVNLYAGERCWVDVVGYDGYDIIGRVVPNNSSPSPLKKTRKKNSSRGRGRRR
eukprot:CAMPEP_0113467050 /NCGR_PEP_ID=MMETSP0014_2-20120614/14606_1 /TAXON_ID=2857 /ORGANISM="Nitzschia sp." /LENGTH=746 /DNA_ID=CAMNT_0000359329 /DNA_START=184 /DNA_END=2424 /DNA_ORIENTATION=+ /assembly_acc=CAM_ASM_000159